MKVVVSGMVAGNPGYGGAAWAVLQYVLGLLQLGHDVYLIEPISESQLVPEMCPLASSHNAAYFLNIARDFQLENCCSLLLQGTTQTVGLPYSELTNISQTATVLLNVSGMLQDADLLENFPYRVYLDLDPAFNQLWHTTQDVDVRFGGHNVFVTVGQAIGGPTCSIPTCGVSWIRTFPPVVLGSWPTADLISHNAFTTIGNWRSYGSIEHDGIFYGQKAHSLRGFIDLPGRCSDKFVLALNIHRDEQRDLEALASNGWVLMDPAKLVGTPKQYQAFIRESKAEFGIAKSGYVVSRCGWFSDRSVCYLASGRPVVAQDTGFKNYLPCGDGLFSFSTPDEAVGAIETINRDYSRHSRYARFIAAEYFNSSVVLPNLLHAIGLSA